LAKKVFQFIILIGDEYQLPPVTGEPVFWQVQTRFALTHIHRQAAGSQPLQLAEKLRKKESIECGPVEVIDEELCRAGMPVIVWRNKTRVELTETIRRKLGFDQLPPQAGEMLICRNGSDRAAKSRGLFNNSIWKVVAADGFECILENQAGDILENEKVFMEELDRGSGTPFRFAYALTCHSAQGSEWPTIMIHEPDAWCYMRALPGEVWTWLYTAVTRSKERVMWVGDQ
jgi:exodeoxyribonuclease-5